MKRKFNLFLIITFASCGFINIMAFDLWAETFTYTYDEVGNMVLKAGDDNDDDGLTNEDEIIHGTDPDNSDSDNDGMPDGWEVTYGTNPLADDANSDDNYNGISNIDEYIAGTDPNEIQTDLVLTNLIIPSPDVKDYRATNSITAGPAFTDESGANVSFQAGNIIILKPGFTASEGSYFHAKIE